MTGMNTYAVYCPKCGKVELTKKQYDQQMERMNSLWKCPRCDRVAEWDQDHYEKAMDIKSDGDGDNP